MGSYKILFVFGLIVAAAWTKPVANEDGLPKDEVLPSSAKAKVILDFGDLKCDDENVEKFVDEKVVNTENGVSASAKASVKFAPKTFKFDWKKMFEKMLAKFEEDQKQETDSKVSELNCEKNKDDESAKQGPFRFSFRVCSTTSAKASAKASSRFCSSDEVKPAIDGTVVAGPDGKPIAVPKPVVAEPVVVKPVVDEPVVDEPVVVEPVVVKPVVDEPLVVKTDEPVELVE